MAKTGDSVREVLHKLYDDDVWEWYSPYDLSVKVDSMRRIHGYGGLSERQLVNILHTSNLVLERMYSHRNGVKYRI